MSKAFNNVYLEISLLYFMTQLGLEARPFGSRVQRSTIGVDCQDVKHTKVKLPSHFCLSLLGLSNFQLTFPMVVIFRPSKQPRNLLWTPRMTFIPQSSVPHFLFTLVSCLLIIIARSVTHALMSYPNVQIIYVVKVFNISYFTYIFSTNI
jgi:hypothetical protein